MEFANAQLDISELRLGFAVLQDQAQEAVLLEWFGFMDSAYLQIYVVSINIGVELDVIV